MAIFLLFGWLFIFLLVASQEILPFGEIIMIGNPSVSFVADIRLDRCDAMFEKGFPKIRISGSADGISRASDRQTWFS